MTGLPPKLKLNHHKKLAEKMPSLCLIKNQHSIFLALCKWLIQWLLSLQNAQTMKFFIGWQLPKTFGRNLTCDLSIA